MKWNRGFLRIWGVIALLWIGYTIWRFFEGCAYFEDSSLFQPVCNTGQFSDGIPVAGMPVEFDVSDWGRWAGSALIPPAVLLGIGVAIVWAFRGFSNPPPSD